MRLFILIAGICNGQVLPPLLAVVEYFTLQTEKAGYIQYFHIIVYFSPNFEFDRLYLQSLAKEEHQTRNSRV